MGAAMTAAEVRRFIQYHPASGDLTWRRSPGAGVRAGAVLGRISVDGYRVFGFRGRKYRANRAVWAMMTGEWPPPALEVEHRDLRRTNDSWANLRLATRAQNQANTGPQKNSRSGLKGVYWHAGGRKWGASICVGGKTRWLGLHDTAEKASAAYAAAAKVHFGAFARVAA